MPFDADAAIGQLTPLIEQATAGATKSDYGYFFKGTQTEKRALLTRMIAAIERLAPRGPYRDQADDILKNTSTYSDEVLLMAGVLDALRADYKAGYMRSVKEWIRADVFADFLEMADELQTTGYKDPAAVLAGGVLEEHLRKLAVASGVEVETPEGKARNTDTINSELAKEEVYSKVTAAQVRGWLGIRNAAAHARWDEYDDAQVTALIRDVRGFLDRHPA